MKMLCSGTIKKTEMGTEKRTIKVANALRVVCSWCGVTIKEVPAEINITSHGMCDKCLEDFKKENIKVEFHVKLKKGGEDK